MKRVLAIILVLAMSVMVLVSCGAADTPEPGQITKTRETVEAGETESTDPVDPVDPTDPVDPGDPTDPDDKEPVSPEVPTGKLEAWESYAAYVEQKSELVTLAMEAIASNEEIAFEMLNLMGVLSIEFMMFPAAMVGQDEDVVRSTFGMMGNTDIKYSHSENDYILEWEDADGEIYRFTSTYDPAKDAMSSEVIFGGDSDDIISYDFIRTPYGYFAQIITNEDTEGGFAAFTQISVDANGGVIGMSSEKVQREELSGKESRDLPKSLPQWYEVDGTNFSTVTSDGQSYNYVFEPETDE